VPGVCVCVCVCVCVGSTLGQRHGGTHAPPFCEQAATAHTRATLWILHVPMSAGEARLVTEGSFVRAFK
jgi:hypothetical protein